MNETARLSREGRNLLTLVHVMISDVNPDGKNLFIER